MMVKTDTQQYVAPEGFNLLSAFNALFPPSNNFSFAAFKRNIARLNTKQELFQWTFQFALWQTQWTYGRVYWTFDLDWFGFITTIKIVFQSTWMSKCHLHIPPELCDANCAWASRSNVLHKLLGISCWLAEPAVGHPPKTSQFIVGFHIYVGHNKSWISRNVEQSKFWISHTLIHIA